MPDIFSGLVRDWDRAEHAVAAHLPHHHAAPQTPAEAPVNLASTPVAAATQQEDTVQLTNIANDIKGAVENADEWVKQVTETHLPAILALAQKYEASPIVQALEGVVLPPEMEQSLANTINELAKVFPATPAATTPAQSVEAQDPAQSVEAQQPAQAPAQ